VDLDVAVDFDLDFDLDQDEVQVHVQVASRERSVIPSCDPPGRGLASARMSVILAYDGKAARIAASAYLAQGSIVTGDVEIGEESSVWFHTVIRGDVNFVRIGARTNVQDHSVLHVTSHTNPTIVGDDVTIGHRVVLHGCTVKDRCLVGIGAIVLDGAVVGPDAMIGAGALVPPGMIVPSGKLVLGAPAKVKRDLTAKEIAFFRTSAASYAGYAARYRQEAPR